MTMRRLSAVLASLAFSCSAFAASSYHGFQIDESAQQLSPEPHECHSPAQAGR